MVEVTCRFHPAEGRRDGLLGRLMGKTPRPESRGKEKGMRPLFNPEFDADFESVKVANATRSTKLRTS